MKLLIEAQYEKDGQKGTARAEVPFETGRHELPDVYPFDQHVNYVGPDAGYSLGHVDVNAKERRITFGYVWIVNLDEEGKGQYLLEKATGNILFLFRLQ